MSGNKADDEVLKNEGLGGNLTSKIAGPLTFNRGNRPNVNAMLRAICKFVVYFRELWH